MATLCCTGFKNQIRLKAHQSVFFGKSLGIPSFLEKSDWSHTACPISFGPLAEWQTTEKGAHHSSIQQKTSYVWKRQTGQTGQSDVSIKTVILYKTIFFLVGHFHKGQWHVTKNPKDVLHLYKGPFDLSHDPTVHKFIQLDNRTMLKFQFARCGVQLMLQQNDLKRIQKDSCLSFFQK